MKNGNFSEYRGDIYCAFFLRFKERFFDDPRFWVRLP